MKDKQLTTAQPVQATALEVRMDHERFPRICQYRGDDAFKKMRKIIFDAYLYKGIAPDGRQVDYIASTLVDEMNQDHTTGVRDLTFEEISGTIRKGVLTKDIMISVASIYKLLVDYIETDGNKLAVQIIQLRKEQQRRNQKQILA